MEEQKKSGYLAKTLICIFSGILLGAVVKLFVLDILHVNGNSMTPTIKDGSALFVNKLAYGIAKPFSKDFFVQWGEPKAGDIVIFLHDNKIVVKRCAATSGTALEFSADSQYILKVNDKIIPLKKEQYERLSSFRCVPDGFVFVLGDNLEQSIDSREYGFVSVKNITGKILGK